MKRIASLAVLALGLFSTATSLAQGPAWKWVQPWTPPRASFTSRVFSCNAAQPFPQIAMDDWICGASGRIVRVTWWGVLSDPAQGRRPFHIAIHDNVAGACVPQINPIYQTCVVPDLVRYCGVDCQQRRVYQMVARLPVTNPFVQVQGTHYWLEVAEADQESIRPGQDDFRWSGHRQLQLCGAVQFPPAFIQPLLDACDGNPDDLSFGLVSRALGGVILLPSGVKVPRTLTLDLFYPNGDLAETLCVEPDGQGNYSVSPEAPDGPYVAVLSGGGMLPVRQTIQLQDETYTQANFSQIVLGDLDGDDHCSLSDLSFLLGSFGL